MATIITVGNKIDKQGSTVTIKSASSIQDTPIVSFFMRNFSALIDRGWSHPVAPIIHINTKAFYAEIDGKIVGHIVYNILEDAYKTAWIVFSCVEDGFRRRGLYMIMHRHFEQIVKNAGSKRIASHVHVDNKVRYASCEAVGMKPDFYRMEKTIA